MSDKVMDTKLIDEKRQKRLEYCKNIMSLKRVTLSIKEK